MPSMATVFTHWKSSAQGFLVFVLVTCQVLSASNIFNGKAANIVSLISALAFAYIGAISKDSGVQVASIAGGPPQAVSSHEVPDSSAAKAVKS